MNNQERELYSKLLAQSLQGALSNPELIGRLTGRLSIPIIMDEVKDKIDEWYYQSGIKPVKPEPRTGQIGFKIKSTS